MRHPPFFYFPIDSAFDMTPFILGIAPVGVQQFFEALMANQTDKHRCKHGFIILLLFFAIASNSIAAFAQLAYAPNVQGKQDIVSSTGDNGNAFTGIDINALIGANRFYDAGYSGSRVIQTNIEGGLIWSGHSTLEHVSHDEVGTGGLGADTDHATSVGQILGGRESGLFPGNHYEQGIAGGATLWSGAIATADYGQGGFEITDASTASVYSALLKGGVNGQTADVFNSSWTYSDSVGNNTIAMGVDGLLYQTGKVGVAAVGNDGSAAVSGLAAGYNSIAVGSLGSELDPTPYNQPSYFSSHGPNDYYNPVDGSVIPGVRSKVDISAPGESLTLAIQTPAGETGNSWYYSYLSGTSFSAPFVAAGASLVVDAGKDMYASDAKAVDGRVVKAVLLNGADKTQFWDNGQQLDNGVVTTYQSLDLTTGAGRLNLNKTYNQYADKPHGGQAGTTDVIGKDCLTDGDCDQGFVAPVGWDFGWANEGGQNLYFLDNQIASGATLTTTLDWYADVSPGLEADFSGAHYNHLSQLDLLVFQFDPITRTIMDTVAQSISIYNQVEHLSFILPTTGYYGLEVINAGDLYNFSDATGEFYGLAWFIALPEPSTPELLLLGLASMVIRRRQSS